MVNIGGFFASLKLETDEESFKKGIKRVEDIQKTLGGMAKSGIVTGVNALAGGVVAVGAAALVLATKTTTAMATLGAQATTLNISARSLDNWKGAVSRAGGDADDFVNSLMHMKEVVRNLKVGQVDESFIKALGMSGVNFAQFQSMNTEGQIKALISARDRIPDDSKFYAIVNQLMGSGGVDLFSRLKNQGSSLGGLYNESSSQNLRTDRDYKIAIEADRKQREIAQQLDQDFAKIGIEIETSLLPALNKFSKWLSENQDTVKKFGEALANVTTFIINTLGWMFESDPQKQKKAFLGGDSQATAFGQLERLRNVKPDSLDESMLLFSPEWHGLSEALKKGDVSDAFAQDLQSHGVGKSSQDTVSQYLKALGKAGYNTAEEYAYGEKVTQDVGKNPNVQLTVIVNKDGSVVLKDTATGKIINQALKVQQNAPGTR